MPTYKGYNAQHKLILERVGVSLLEAFPPKHWEILHILKNENRAVLCKKTDITQDPEYFLHVEWIPDPQTIAPPPPQTITDASEEKLIVGGQVNEIVKDIMNVPNEDKPPKPKEKESQPTKLNTMNISIDRVDGTSNAPEFIVLTINGHPYIYKLSSQG